MTIDYFIEHLGTDHRGSQWLGSNTNFPISLPFQTFIWRVYLKRDLLEAGYIRAPNTFIKVKILATTVRKNLHLVVTK